MNAMILGPFSSNEQLYDHTTIHFFVTDEIYLVLGIFAEVKPFVKI